MTGQQPWADLITYDDVLRLHARGLREHGGDGDSTELEEGCVEGSLGSAWSARKYLEVEEAIPGLIFAAYAMFYLAVKHCFLDGNKRLGWAVGAYILAKMGLTIDAPDEEAYQMVLAMLDEKEPDAVVRWIADRLLLF